MIRALLISGLMLAAAPLAADNFYGAVVYSFESGKHGASWNYKTEAEANDRAMKECAKKGGKNCQLGVRVSNSCGAFAVAAGATKMSSAGSSWGYNTHDDAKARALKECKKRSKGQTCTVVASTCNFGK